jgi:glycosyltransferase involved in cell wall biosynthesis
MKKRVLIVHPSVRASGGTHSVAAWALQALRDTCDVSLATLEPVDYARVNRTFGTSLRPGDFKIYLPSASYGLLRRMPYGELFKMSLAMRHARQIDRLEHFDVLIGTHDEADFGRRGIHYIHFPWAFFPRPKAEMPWLRKIPGALRGYRLLCLAVAGGTKAGLRRNLPLANSTFIAGLIRAAHGVDSAIVYPPVAGVFPDIPWEQRGNAFVAIGRMDESKRWDMAVAILDEVRRRGHDVKLTLIGSPDKLNARLDLSALAAKRPWFRILSGLSRDELATEVASHRYGIHTMENEHFGMAPAEIQRAGCIVFAHNSGGPVEIVGGDSRLLFNGIGDAADKIVRVLTSHAEEESLRRHVAAQRERFTAEKFCSSLQTIVNDFDPVPQC